MDTMIKGKTNNMTQDMVSNIKEEMLNIKKKRKDLQNDIQNIYKTRTKKLWANENITEALIENIEIIQNIEKPSKLSTTQKSLLKHINLILSKFN